MHYEWPLDCDLVHDADNPPPRFLRDMPIQWQAAGIDAIPDMESHEGKDAIKGPDAIVDETALNNFEAITNRQVW